MTTNARWVETESERVSGTSQNVAWWDRVDQGFERLGDRLNPILVKETRQALKSRQFVVTFSLLLFTALAWTIAGSLSQMPYIYTSPSAPRLLIGYYLVLAIPMLLVVPLAAYRSLEGEIDDGTLELLSISALGPWQIVLGKLASAMLQMMLYFVALFPCVAYAYTLRGVDLPTTLLILSILVLSAVLLTIVALFFAPLARSRGGRVGTLIAVMLLLVLSQWGIGTAVVALILEGNPIPPAVTLFLVVAAVLLVTALGHLLLTATAAQLTPPSENRSSGIRVSLMILTSLLIGMMALAMRLMGREGEFVGLAVGGILVTLWAICGSMLVSESPTMTPRIRRELPRSFLARCSLTWLTPGPATGLVFATVNIAMVAFAMVLIAGPMSVFGQPNVAPRLALSFVELVIAVASYLIGFLMIVRLMIAGIRIKNHPRVEVGLAAMIVVVVLSALIPYSLGLHLNDYRAYEYSAWQITNWAWTVAEIERGREMGNIVRALVIPVTMAFFAFLVSDPKLVLPRRTATPERVLEASRS